MTASALITPTTIMTDKKDDVDTHKIIAEKIEKAFDILSCLKRIQQKGKSIEEATEVDTHDYRDKIVIDDPSVENEGSGDASATVEDTICKAIKLTLDLQELYRKNSTSLGTSMSSSGTNAKTRSLEEETIIKKQQQQQNASQEQRRQNQKRQPAASTKKKSLKTIAKTLVQLNRFIANQEVRSKNLSLGSLSDIEEEEKDDDNEGSMWSLPTIEDEEEGHTREKVEKGKVKHKSLKPYIRAVMLMQKIEKLAQESDLDEAKEEESDDDEYEEEFTSTSTNKYFASSNKKGKGNKLHLKSIIKGLVALKAVENLTEEKWIEKIEQFEWSFLGGNSTSSLNYSSSNLSATNSSSSSSSSKIITAKQQDNIWRRAFLKIIEDHPRTRILEYFDEIARHGATDFGDNADPHHNSSSSIDYNHMKNNNLLKHFKRSSIFTIWRSTPIDAIRKMICQEAVGKGLDIKGKSARHGKLSGFVPFLQITNNNDKTKVNINHYLSSTYKDNNGDYSNVMIKLFFTDNIESGAEEVGTLEEEGRGREAREIAVQNLYRVRDEVFSNSENNKYAIKNIDDYIPSNRYGLEIPVELFWETYIIRGDIDREVGSTYDTGRSSQPFFQLQNVKTLCFLQNNNDDKQSDSFCPQPIPVILQHSHSPMNPFELLIAYEQQVPEQQQGQEAKITESMEEIPCGNVLPVVSDFDCFLVGTRNVSYTEPLPPDQLELLRWSISQIKEILHEKHMMDATADSTAKTNKDVSASASINTSWLDRWCQIELPKVNVPQFGFGDPKSYCIMENAILNLGKASCEEEGGLFGSESQPASRKKRVGSGAVRHGAECFNYIMPQDMENEFLIISENVLPPNDWKYVDQAGLLEFLNEKVDDNFTFPLNPKWILCDSNGEWNKLYQKLLQSKHKNVIESMKTWFPTELGIREEIEHISKTYPNGY